MSVLVRKNLRHDKYKKFVSEKVRKKYDFFDLEFIKYKYFLYCKDINQVVKGYNKKLDAMAKEVLPHKTYATDRFRAEYIQLMKQFLANLTAKDGDMILSMSMDDYKKGGMYNGIFSYVLLRKIVADFENRGYIEVEHGKQRSHNTIVYPQKKLWMEFGELENLKLRVRKISHVTGFSEGKDKYSKIVEIVERQENTLSKHNVTVKYKNDNLKKKYSDRFKENELLGETLFRRSFLGFGQGGRFYARGKGGIYQRMPGELRECLRIDGEETIEIDYKCEHLNILYAKENIDMWKVMNDAYNIDGVKCDYRFVVKTALLVMLNCKDESNLFNIVYAHFNKDKEQWRRKIFFEKFMQEYGTPEKFNEFVQKIKDKHFAISKYFCSGIGKRLQRIDSDIMSDILENCLNNDIIALPVHDSVIVKKKDLIKVKEIMYKAFKEQTGFNAIITTD